MTTNTQDNLHPSIEPLILSGEARTIEDNLPASMDTTDKIKYDGKNVAAHQIIIFPKDKIKLEELIVQQRWKILAKSGFSWQVDVGQIDLYEAIKIINNSTYGEAMLNNLLNGS